MLRQAANLVQVEGILNEIRLEESSFKDKTDGSDRQCIRGSIIVKVPQVIDGVEVNSLIPVYVFANKYDKMGNISSSYDNMRRVMTEYVSVAASDEATADRVRISRGNLRMNDYYGSNGTLYSEPRIQTAYISKVPKDAANWTPKAVYEIEFTLVDKQEELDADGVPTGRLKLKAAVPQYAGKVDLFEFIVQNPKAVEIVSQYWQTEKSYRASGLFNYITKTEEFYDETEYDFGEPVKHTRTKIAREILVAGGSHQSLPDELAFDVSEISQGLVERKTALEARRESDMARAKARTAPIAQPQGTNAFADLGF